jgi:hypothetical protein
MRFVGRRETESPPPPFFVSARGVLPAHRVAAALEEIDIPGHEVAADHVDPRHGQQAGCGEPSVNRELAAEVPLTGLSFGPDTHQPT